MPGIQSKIARHSKRQGTMTHNEGKYQSTGHRNYTDDRSLDKDIKNLL